MQKPIILLEAERLIINGHIFIGPAASDEFEYAIGEKGIIDTSMPPAPWGHKNNIRYFFPSHGVSFTEHHATEKVSGISCIYDPEDGFNYYNQMTSTFSGLLKVYGAQIKTLQFGKDLVFHQDVHIEMLVSWSLTVSCGNTQAVFSLMGKKLPSKRRSKNRHVVDVWLGFKLR